MYKVVLFLADGNRMVYEAEFAEIRNTAYSFNGGRTFRVLTMTGVASSEPSGGKIHVHLGDSDTVFITGLPVGKTETP